MKFCEKCGQALVDDAEFCTSCGTKIGKLEESTSSYANQNNLSGNYYQNNNTISANNINSRVIGHNGLTITALILLILTSIFYIIAMIMSFVEGDFTFGGVLVFVTCVAISSARSVNKSVKTGIKIKTSIKVITLFANIISGILLLCDKDH